MIFEVSGVMYESIKNIAIFMNELRQHNNEKEYDL